MLLATILALAAAVMHAGWNLVAKRADGDRYLVLWAQFFAAGLMTLPLLVGYQLIWGMPWQGYMWASISGCVHVPYMWLLARAYSLGDFSISYPVARGGGAALAATGGVIALGDHLSLPAVLGIGIVVCGLILLAYGAHGRSLGLALLAAVSIGLYSTIDGKGVRATPEVIGFVLATMCAGAITNTTFALIIRKPADMSSMFLANWWRAFVTGLATVVTYGMVLVAFTYAPIGYVTALRESSVVLAALAGWRLLGEGDHRRRLTAAAVVFAGLVVLVVGR
ncbi:MAG: EamA family transporter [Actinobacteria bacterium]|nr:EamA family transporter [Actinomycetota bacterium]